MVLEKADDAKELHRLYFSPTMTIVGFIVFLRALLLRVYAQDEHEPMWCHIGYTDFRMIFRLDFNNSC